MNMSRAIQINIIIKNLKLISYFNSSCAQKLIKYIITVEYIRLHIHIIFNCIIIICLIEFETCFFFTQPAHFIYYYNMYLRIPFS